MSINPFAYHPAQIAKALAALLTSIIGLLGIAATSFADGGLATAGHWATTVALFLTPIVVFLKKAQPLMDALDGAPTALAKLDPTDPAAVQHSTE